VTISALVIYARENTNKHRSLRLRLTMTQEGIATYECKFAMTENGA